VLVYLLGFKTNFMVFHNFRDYAINRPKLNYTIIFAILSIDGWSVYSVHFGAKLAQIWHKVAIGKGGSDSHRPPF